MTTENRKTLIFSFDGTGNEPADVQEFTEDESISNVLKLHILMGGGIHMDRSSTKTPGGHTQKTYYYNGIGTREGKYAIPLLGALITQARQYTNMMFSPTFGDVRRILEEAKQDFRDAKYQSGDRLLVFGFSRGAALARKFVSMILNENEKCHVSFLGVFDTVAAMNGIHRKGDRINSDVVFENGTLHGRVEKAVHLIALDEDRVPFTPTLINRDSDNPDRILEVWLPGVHSDIGGGYWMDGLSDLALEFMTKQCKKELGEDIYIGNGRDNTEIQQLLDDQKDDLSGIKVDDIAIHPLLHSTMHLHSGFLAKAGNQEPRSVHVNINDRPSKELPIVHHCVKERFEKAVDYRPVSLRGLKFELLYEDGKENEGIQGIAGLRDYKCPQS